MRRAVAVAVLLSSSLLSCGGSSSNRRTCPSVTGTFKARSTLESTEGTCRLAKAVSVDAIAFDAKGAFVSPLEGVVTCVTTQDGCDVHVTCDTNVVRARGQFDGVLAEDGQSLVGTATVAGSFQGCTRMTYSVDASRTVTVVADQ